MQRCSPPSDSSKSSSSVAGAIVVTPAAAGASARGVLCFEQPIDALAGYTEGLCSRLHVAAVARKRLSQTRQVVAAAVGGPGCLPLPAALVLVERLKLAR